MWCYFLLLFTFGQIILPTDAVNMCTSGSAASTSQVGLSTESSDVVLNLINGTGVSGCNCSVRLHNADQFGSNKTKIIFKAVKFTGCKHKLVISYYNNNSRFSCNTNNPVYHDINKTDEIKLYLESTSSPDDTTFQVKITSSVTAIGGPLLRLDCSPPNATLSTTQISIALTQTTMSTIINTSESTASTQDSPSGSPAGSKDKTDISSLNTSPKPQITSESKMNNEEMAGKKENDSDLDIGLIGGVAGGVLILVIVIIVIIICIVRRRKTKSGERRDYSRPIVTVPEHGYTDIDLQTNGNNSSPNGVKANVPNGSADPALPQQPNNSEHTGNGPVEMIIIENDLYVSSDDLKDFKSRDDNITNQNPEISNGQGEMEIIENDFYVSSGDGTLNSPPNNDNAPVYASVNKKPRRPTSDLDDDNSKDDFQNGTLNSLSNNDNAPVYVVVNKKPKRPTSDLNDDSIDAVQNDHITSL